MLWKYVYLPRKSERVSCELEAMKILNIPKLEIFFASNMQRQILENHTECLTLSTEKKLMEAMPKGHNVK